MRSKYIENMRAFSRFYTNMLGLLNTHILDSRYSLAEVRILYELYHHKNYTATDIIDVLRMDKGQLSRMLQKFGNARLVTRSRSSQDKRSQFLSLTAKGIKEFEILNNASNDQIRRLFINIPEGELAKLTRHMKEIQRILHPSINYL